MKYLIVGGGAIGSVLAAYMTRAGKDITLLTRGAHLDAIRRNGGMKLHYAPENADHLVPVKVAAEADYDDKPDVVIVTVKAYSLDSIYPLLNRVCQPNTIVVPLINALDIGHRIDAGIAGAAIVAQGEAYVACELVAPGECKHKLDFFRIVFGPRLGCPPFDGATEIRQDLIDCGCTAEISDHMLQAALMKFCRVSALSGAMVYYNVPLGTIVADPEKRAFLVSLCEELVAIADAAGCPFPPEFDAVDDLLTLSRSIDPNYKTSLMYDFLAGKTIESETMFEDPYRLGRQHGLEMASYAKVCNLFGHAS
ncbi:2-dehydropantoate 2-reductase [Pseudonocardia sp. C8]|uniref:ketopantoate reductase family protein n=1 Tax=Pseudonocardia sp. C8 TaxID=2762759 RepID=UPI00164331E9|nr:2-dehydropantoate 2-reductase [Pseudonocardia sp. C8]MBC3194884.1 2-dehydropantoate 2-reductase [Pseudonocardia sp. C8]